VLAEQNFKLTVERV